MSDNVLICRKRLLIILIILVTLMVLLILRTGYWNVVRGEDLQEEAEEQWISDLVVEANRGDILDRNYNVLAQSASADTVVLMPQQISDPNLVASALSGILEMDAQEIYTKAATKTRTGEDGDQTEIVEVWLARQIDSDKAERIEALDLDGVKLIEDVKRYYPNQDFAAQVIGYTTLDGQGQTGIEMRYDTILEGRQGRMVAELDKFNNDIPNGEQMVIEPVDGQNVVLTIDEVMQSFLEAECEDALLETGAQTVQGTVIDITNGEILAMANMPAFDLNDPPRSDGEILSAMSSNIITAEIFQPGNIFTPVAAAVASDTGTVRESYTCEGAQTVENEEIVCAHEHGTQTFEQAVMNGCSIAGAQMAEDIGKDVFYGYLKSFGFGEQTGIDYTTDAAGNLPELKYVSEGDIVRMGAGETIEVSQLQLLNAVSAIINGGDLYVPKLVMALTNEDGVLEESYDAQLKETVLDSSVSSSLKTIMQAQVNSGAASEIRISGYTSGALFGEVQKYDAYDAVVEGQSISTFMMFAPIENPKYLVSITLNGVAKTDNSDMLAGNYTKDVLEGILKYSNIKPDDQTVVAQQEITVPDVVEMGMSSAADTLTEAGLTYTTNGAGTVLSQSPAAGTIVAPNTNIELSMDTVPPEQDDEPEEDLGMITIPDFSGLTIDQARDLAIQNGLTFFAQGDGVAYSQYPVAGVNVAEGSKVTVSFRLQLGEG